MTEAVLSRYLCVSPHVYRASAGDNQATYRILWSTRSGKVLPVPSETYSKLRAGQRLDAHSALYSRMVTAEMLVDPSRDERAEVIDRLQEGSRNTAFREFTLLPTANCNMGCAYCGQSHSPGDVGVHIRNAMQERVVAALQDPAVAKVAVRWFGGEPMLAYRHVLAMGAEQKEMAEATGTDYESRMVTNGSLLTVERLRRLHNDAGIGLFCITIDGPDQVHNARRLMKAGGATFRRIRDVVVAALADADLASCRFLLRTNVDRQNAPFIEEYLRDCVDAGFADPRVTFDIAPVHGWSNDAETGCLQPDDYASSEAAWLRYMAANGLRFPVVPGSPKATTCVAVKQAAEVLSATGAVFSCTEKPLVTSAERSEVLIPLADLLPSQPRPAGPYDDWHDALRAGETACKECPMLGVCGGSCPKLWREESWPCPSYKRNWPQRLEILAERAGLTRVADDARTPSLARA